MNPIAKLADKTFCWIGFKKKSTPNNGGKPANKTAVYTESGWTAEVEILADNSDAEQYRYTLRVIKTLADGYLGRLHDGHIFNVFAVKQYAAYCGWRLSAAGF